jgi:2-oxoisovalerate ferredoxin oxidoreductase beta subunit
MANYNVIYEKPEAFYTNYDRKAELQDQTHYCPGCGHGVAQKLLAMAIDELGVKDRTVLVNPVGCSVFGYYYFDVGNLQVAHGRAPAAATGMKRSRPEAIVIGYQGDGDLAAIGTAEIIHAANRGEMITVIFVNNGIYGMTGGQMAPTTPLGKRTATSPTGRDEHNDGFPLHMCELLNTLEAPVFIERVAVGNNKQVMAAAKVLKRALENQVKGLGFSFVEVLSPCPTIWKMQPGEAKRFVETEMAAIFPVANFRDRSKTAEPRAPRPAPPALEQLPELLGLDRGEGHVAAIPPCKLDLKVKVAGFGGQGVLMLGEVLAEAGLDAGYEVSWLPSYGPEMRSGTSNCHVRIANHVIDSPLVSRPNVLLAFNEPSLKKFLPSVEEGGIVLYNDHALPEGCTRSDVRMVALPFMELADQVGSTKVGNMVMLGTLLEATGMLDQDRVVGAIRSLINPKFFELDLAALERGRKEFREKVADRLLCPA